MGGKGEREGGLEGGRWGGVGRMRLLIKVDEDVMEGVCLGTPKAP